MARDRRDPRSEAEKARADLKRNAEMGSAPAESPLTRHPSVTPDTFGEHWEKARIRSGTDQGIEAGGMAPAGPGGGSESLADAAQVTTGRDGTKPAGESREDAPSRAKK